MIKKWINIFLRTFYTGDPGDPCPHCGTFTVESGYWAGAERCPNSDCDWRCCKF